LAARDARAQYGKSQTHQHGLSHGSTCFWSSPRISVRIS
jgi:hypothetical protein